MNKNNLLVFIGILLAVQIVTAQQSFRGTVLDELSQTVSIGAWVNHVTSWFIDQNNDVEADPYKLVNIRSLYNLPFLERMSIGATVFNVFDAEFFSRTEFDFVSNPIGASPDKTVWFLFNVIY
ncbi:MAG: hypothetical protein AAF348_04540 [Bacteroidota bacterium]